MNARLGLLAVIAAFSPSLVAAQAVRDKPQVTLDPGKAYVLYTTNKLGQAMELIRDPNADDIAAYRNARAEALLKAHKKYERQLKTWQEETDENLKRPGYDPVKKPIEPTEQSFTYHPIEFDTMVQIGPSNRFYKDDQHSVYLQEVVPGTYAVYGPIASAAETFIGTCLCMGTVQFKAEPGVIIDMGYMSSTLYEAARKAKSSGGTAIRDALDLPEGTTSFSIDPTPGKPVDPRIGSFPIKPATYKPAGKHSNWHGVALDRLTEMPGVFRYDRDKMIDLTSTAP